MLDTWVWGTLTFVLSLLFGLQGVSANKTVTTCDILNCPKGLTCCDNGCCPERKFWDLESNHFRILYIIICAILPVLFICGLCIYSKCRDLQHDVRTSDHQTPPDLPSIASLESIRITSFDPPPSYTQLGLSVTIPNVFHSRLSNISK